MMTHVLQMDQAVGCDDTHLAIEPSIGTWIEIRETAAYGTASPYLTHPWHSRSLIKSTMWGEVLDIETFLVNEFLRRRVDTTGPDGRLLYLYRCEDQEFWCLVDLLRRSGPPGGHDFDRYRELWPKFSESVRLRAEYVAPAGPTPVEWTVRGFVLYASEFWLRFKNDEWRNSIFPDDLPFRRLTWLHFLSLVGWTKLYHDKIAGYVDVGDKYRIAHTDENYAWDNDQPELMEESKPNNKSAPQYPGLYFPMLAAWNWWKVRPVRLPTSIRYLDTFAHQGGASNRLEIECEIGFESGSKLVYRPTSPPHGYGMDSLSFEVDWLPPSADPQNLRVELVFDAVDKAHTDRAFDGIDDISPTG